MTNNDLCKFLFTDYIEQHSNDFNNSYATEDYKESDRDDYSEYEYDYDYESASTTTDDDCFDAEAERVAKEEQKYQERLAEIESRYPVYRTELLPYHADLDLAEANAEFEEYILYWA